MTWQLPIGAQLQDDGVRFRLWAPGRARVEVSILDFDGQELERHPLDRDFEGYFAGYVAGCDAGTRYLYRLDGDLLRPDPASRYQPETVHGPSEVVDPGFAWTDDGWRGISLEDAVIYETHVGTATPEGSFESLIGRLPYLKELGVTAVEIMPVGDFPGERNWGYDGVCLYAPARAYGGPAGLKKLVDAAHARGLAVILDVVYNHLGPAGNYLRDFSRDYFTQDKHTPWGDAVNFEPRPVRDFFINNAIYWAQEYHVDGLRLDATHAILDDSPQHFLRELTVRVRGSLPPEHRFLFFAEDERNEVNMLRPVEDGGNGMDAVWADDFHHEVRSALAGDDEGYYADFAGSARELAETLRKGWFYTGQLSEFGGHPRGTDASDLDPPRFVYCIQNHDQVGNRAFGDRLTESVDDAAYRAASALLLLSPATPLLFQGQEWAAGTPFLFFTDHDAELGRMVTAGRRAEFAHFASFQGAEIPDPQALSTFEASKLRWDELDQERHRRMLDLYRELLRLRATLPALRDRGRPQWQSEPVGDHAVALRYRSPGGDADMLLLMNLKGELDADLALNELTGPPRNASWQLVISSDDPRYGGDQDPGALQKQVDSGKLTARGTLAIALHAARG